MKTYINNVLVGDRWSVYFYLRLYVEVVLSLGCFKALQKSFCTQTEVTVLTKQSWQSSLISQQVVHHLLVFLIYLNHYFLVVKDVFALFNRNHICFYQGKRQLLVSLGQAAMTGMHSFGWQKAFLETKVFILRQEQLSYFISLIALYFCLVRTC